MKKKHILAATLLVILMALGALFAHLNVIMVVMTLASMLGLIGSTVTYADPVTGSTAPTPAQSAVVQSVTAVVNFGDSDTTATITHNFSLSTPKLGKLRPWVTVLLMAGSAVYPGLTWALNANNLVVTKASTAGTSGGTYNVVIQRPWTPLSTIDPVTP